MTTRRVVGLLLAGVVLVAGCCNLATKPEAAADPNKVFSQVDACMSAGDTNGALKVLAGALQDKGYAQNRGWFYGSILNILLMGDRVDEAKAAYLKVIGRDEELTRVGFDLMYGYYQRKGDPSALEAWVAQMMAAPLPKDLLAQAYTWQIGLLRDKKQFDKVVELAPVCIRKFDVGTSCRMLGETAAAEMSTGQYDNAGRLLDAIEKNAGSKRDLKDLVAMDRVDILFLRGDLPDAEKQFAKVAAVLRDDPLAEWASRVVGRCISQQQLDLADRLCENLLKLQKSKVASRRVAASRWIEVARVRKDIADIPVRLEALRAEGIAPSDLLSLYEREFYAVLGDGKKTTIVALLAFGDKIEKDLPNEDDKAQVRAMALDGSCIVEDYQRCLEIVLVGIPDRDKKWQETVICKAKAHIAFQEGKYKEAVEYFRQFMAGIATWDKTETDPIMGITYTKEMVLGRNARRIGDIWIKAGDQKSAADAYTEAKGYYENALVRAMSGSKEADLIRTELAGIGKPAAAKQL